MSKGKDASDHDICMEFRNELQRVISCVAPSSHFYYRTDKPGGRETLVLAPVASLEGITSLRFQAAHDFVVKRIKGAPEPSTIKYVYELEDDDGPILRFDYSEVQGVWAHLHVLRSGNVGGHQLANVHFPTNRITLEQVVRLLHRDFEVPYLPDDATAERILKETETKHKERRTGPDL